MLANAGYAIRVPILLCLPIILSMGVTYLITTWRYHWQLNRFADSRKQGVQVVHPPQIPYIIPWLGNAREFLTPYPGRYWEKLMSCYPRSNGVCTLLVAGKRSHILFSPVAVQALFKTKLASRDVFDQEVLRRIFGFTQDETTRAIAGKPVEHKITARYLLNNDAVNELTATFTQIFDDVLDRGSDMTVASGDTCLLYDFVRGKMFEASVRALLGEWLFPMYPEFCDDFYLFDREFLKFYFGYPRVFAKELYANRERILANLTKWSHEIHNEVEQPPKPSSGPAWDPIFGSRLNRARQEYYRTIGLSARSAAGFDLGIVFALNSNIVPTVGWMLMHLFSLGGDVTLLPRLMEELSAAEKGDGGLDIPTLMSAPLLQSIWTETLRLYTDVLVPRNLLEDITLPLDRGGKKLVFMRKGDNIYAPCWASHYDAETWTGEVAHNKWHGERFITVDSNTGKRQFSMTGASGGFFPFGGGKTICPGRTFAKQEGLAALAMFLLRFDFDVLGFTDHAGQPTQEFPSFAPVPSGSGAIALNGDLRVRMKKRTTKSSYK